MHEDSTAVELLRTLWSTDFVRRDNFHLLHFLAVCEFLYSVQISLPNN